MNNNENMIKILFIHHAQGWGGAPINIVNIINALDKSRFDAEVLLLHDSVVSRYLDQNQIKFRIASSSFYIKYYRYFAHTEPSHLKWFQWYKFIKLSFLWILSHFVYAPKELMHLDYDIVHLNSSVLTDWIAPCKKKGKVIMHIQEPFKIGKYNVLSLFFRYQMQLSDKIIAISEDNAQRINLPDKTIVIYNYADVPTSTPNNESYSSKKFLYLGGSAYIKGFYTMVNSLPYLNKDIRIFFAGYYGSQKSSNRLKSIIKNLIYYQRMNAISKMRKSQNAVEIDFTNDVNKYFDECCCLLSPFSVSHFSRPVIEAHLHKKAVIVSDVPGMDEIVCDNVNGIIVKRNNPQELAKAINWLSQHPEKAKEMGDNGYEVAIQKYTPENIHHFQEVYNSLLN